MEWSRDFKNKEDLQTKEIYKTLNKENSSITYIMPLILTLVRSVQCWQEMRPRGDLAERGRVRAAARDRRLRNLTVPSEPLHDQHLRLIASV